MRTAAGGIRRQQFISIECSSDYWGIYWNGDRLGALATRATEAPFDNEFGLQTGGASSGFSVAQVERALNDISELWRQAGPSVIISSSAGASNSCDEGLLQWSRSNFGSSEGDSFALGTRLLQIFDDRSPKSRPEEATLSNLAEDTGNSVRWFSRLTTGTKPDLGIIAQLESSSPALEPIDIGSALSVGGLLTRDKASLPAIGAFNWNRTGIAGPPSGDGRADKLMTLWLGWKF
jgi:hypothetical protein